MADPTRLIEEDGGDTVSRELLLAGRREGLPSGERDRLWSAVAAAALVTPAIAAPASAASAAAAATAGSATALAKVTVAAVVLGVASLAGYHASRPTAPPKVVAAVAPEKPTLPTLPAPTAQEPPREPSPPPAQPARAREPARLLYVPPSSRTPSPSHLAAESRLVVEARRALREGDAAGALRRLEAGSIAFAGGALVQEREALTIEALARTGHTGAAAARAEAFLHAYPHSPHESAVRAFARP